MKKTLLMIAGGVLVCGATNAVGFDPLTHTKTVPVFSETASAVDAEYPLFPEESGIAGFPKAIAEDEADLTVIETYYRTVADAYQNHAEEHLQRAASTQEKMITRHQDLAWQKIRTTGSENGKKLDAIEKAKLQVIDHQHARLVPSVKAAEEASRKAKFYNTMADTCAELQMEQHMQQEEAAAAEATAAPAPEEKL